MFEIDDGPRDNVGAYLKFKREEKKIPLEEIAENIKVRPIFLEAIEANKLDLLPGEVYEKTFIKAYAEYLGLDFDELCQRFFGEGKKEETKLKLPLKSKKKSGLSWGIVIFTIIIILLSTIIILSLTKLKKGETKEEHSKLEVQNLELVYKSSNSFGGCISLLKINS